MAEDVDLDLDEPVGGNRTLSVALGVLVVLSLLVLGYYYRRPPGIQTELIPTPSASPSGKPEVLPPPVEVGVIKVYVAGEVKKPGVVTLEPGARVEQAIQKAGGMTPQADPLAINLASRLKDEQMIVVPARGASPSPVATFSPEEEETPPADESGSGGPEPAPPPDAPPAGQSGQQPNWNQYLSEKPAKVSLNKASQAELEAIPGVGPKTAADIVAYRKTSPFTSVEDLLRVPGIGDKKLESIRPYVDL